MDQLDDIYLQELPWWVNWAQPGWMLLCILILLAVLLLVWYIKDRGTRYQRKRFLRYISTQPELEAAQANAVLKAYINAIGSNQPVNAMRGKQWRAFLLANCDLRGHLHDLDFLTSTYYEKPSQKQPQLQNVVQHWIRKHRRKVRAP